MLNVSVSPVSLLADEMEKKRWLGEDPGTVDGGAFSAGPFLERLCHPMPEFEGVATCNHDGLSEATHVPDVVSVAKRPLLTADPNALASRYNSTPSSSGTPQLMQDASPSPTPYIRRRLDVSLDKVPGCGTARRSSSHRQRRKHRGPSASADFDLNKENRMQDWLCPTSQQPAKAKRKLYCGHSPPATAGRRGQAKRQCSMYQSMPGPPRFDGFGGLAGPSGGRTPDLPRHFEGGVFAHRSVPHLDTSSMHIIEDRAHLHPSSGRGSLSHKPPLSPYCPSGNPSVNSFSASFGMFSADRVQSSPCIMQTDHAESAENTRLSHEPMQEGEAREGLPAGSGECLDGMGAFLQGNRRCGLGASSISLLAKPCDLVSHPHLVDITASPADGWHPDTQAAVRLQLPGMASLSVQADVHPSTSEEDALQQGASTSSDCQTLAQPVMGEAHATNQAMLVDPHMMCCSSSDDSAVEAAAEAASVSGLTATSSPCCTFQLPTALSQGIAASPAPSGDTSSEGSARRKSFSPLESGPVSILPLIENALIGLPSVSCSTLAQLIAGQHASPSIQMAIVDCRYPYEYAGGHIPGSINIASPDGGEALTFGSTATLQGQSTAIVLYCEFSSERAPRMFRYLRNMDRRKHLADYPKLTFPHMYVLKGGYQTFHEQFPSMCNPQHAYIRMHDAAHLEDHKASRKTVKAAWDSKAACSRSLM